MRHHISLDLCPAISIDGKRTHVVDKLDRIVLRFQGKVDPAALDM